MRLSWVAAPGGGGTTAFTARLPSGYRARVAEGGSAVMGYDGDATVGWTWAIHRGDDDEPLVTGVAYDRHDAVTAVHGWVHLNARPPRGLRRMLRRRSA